MGRSVLTRRAPGFVALATCRELPEPDVDESLLVRALEDLDVPTRVLAWDDDDAPWDGAALTVLRSTWNYHRFPDRFLAWASRRGAALANDPAVIRWNHHKRYLRDLEARGVPVVPTLWFQRGTTPDVAKVGSAWRDVVVKPAVSAGSYRTARLGGEWYEDRSFLELVSSVDTMVQPYVASVEAYGERSIVMIDGEVTHAIRKNPRFSGDAEAVSAAVPVAPDERALAVRAAACANAPLLYARADLVRDDAGTVMVGELELIEPSLFLQQSPEACARLASAIRGRFELAGR